MDGEVRVDTNQAGEIYVIVESTDRFPGHAQAIMQPKEARDLIRPVRNRHNEGSQVMGAFEDYTGLAIAKAKVIGAEEEAGTADEIAKECYKLDRVRTTRLRVVVEVVK